MSEYSQNGIASLEKIVQEQGLELPNALKSILRNAKEASGKENDKDVRSYVYRAFYDFLAHENGIGGGSSLIYPPVIVDTIRHLYPGDIKNYTPKSGKRKNFYEVTLEEFIQCYHEADLRDSFKSKDTQEDSFQASKKQKH